MQSPSKNMSKIAHGEMDFYNKLKNKKILLVDDDMLVRDSLSIFFEAHGCNLTALATAQDGIETLYERDFDIVITDYRLSDMGFIERLRESRPDRIIIVITAYDRRDVVSRDIADSIDGYMEKPLTARRIEECLARVIAS